MNGTPNAVEGVEINIGEDSMAVSQGTPVRFQLHAAMQIVLKQSWRIGAQALPMRIQQRAAVKDVWTSAPAGHNTLSSAGDGNGWWARCLLPDPNQWLPKTYSA